MRERFDTTIGTVEVLFDDETRVVSAQQFGAGGQPLAAFIESWDSIDFADVLIRQLRVPWHEAEEIASGVGAVAGSSPLQAPMFEGGEDGLGSAERSAVPESAGLALRFVAVLLDAVIVLFPLAIVVGILSGGAYRQSDAGTFNAGVNVSGNAFWLMLLLGLGYYVLCEGTTGMTLGKRMVGIRVVDEDGEAPTLTAAVIRNVLRVIDGLFFYLIGAVIALASPRRQRLGDRAAHTIVVRR